MPDLRLGKLPNRTPSKLTLSLWPELDERLRLYAERHSAQTGQVVSAADIAPHILADYIEGDREFARVLKASKAKAG
ncbi:DUF2274 domain-containing protein [Caulobacter segnis]|uniref:DUF2274 domain-containing protein n=1 Tax=Caulobacter segnis TaxID=88688 RepID=UPI002859E28B|nr:DUF2274 domain-containing protein [Caulobacter segnis]MDR6623810.1 hypothetical protein [Caulobacter segnis]